MGGWGAAGEGQRADSCLFMAPQRVWTEGENCPGVQVNTEEAEKRVASSSPGRVALHSV